MRRNCDIISDSVYGYARRLKGEAVIPFVKSNECKYKVGKLPQAWLEFVGNEPEGEAMSSLFLFRIVLCSRITLFIHLSNLISFSRENISVLRDPPARLCLKEGVMLML